MAAIVDFTHNAIAEVLSNHTTMSGVFESRIVDTKIMLLRQFENDVNLYLNLAEMEAILDFTPIQCPK